MDYIYGLQPVRSLSDAIRIKQKIYVRPGQCWIDETVWAKERQSLAGLKDVRVVVDSNSVPEPYRQAFMHQKIVMSIDVLPPAEDDWHDQDIFLALDGVTDPQNLGAILRTAKAMGVGAVVMPKHRQASLSPLVRRIAQGAAERLPVIVVNNLSQWVAARQESGYWCYGASAFADQSLAKQSFDVKSVIVVGSEGKGIRQKLMDQCDFTVSIPTDQSFSSLNVVQASAMLLYAYRCQYPM